MMNRRSQSYDKEYLKCYESFTWASKALQCQCFVTVKGKGVSPSCRWMLHLRSFKVFGSIYLWF